MLLQNIEILYQILVRKNIFLFIIFFCDPISFASSHNNDFVTSILLELMNPDGEKRKEEAIWYTLILGLFDSRLHLYYNTLSSPLPLYSSPQS